MRIILESLILKYVTTYQAHKPYYPLIFRGFLRLVAGYSQPQLGLLMIQRGALQLNTLRLQAIHRNNFLVKQSLDLRVSYGIIR
jgi:hypothetical protein